MKGNKELAASFLDLTSSLYVLGVKLKGFHWNIIGDQFFPMHVLLDKQVDSMFGFADGAAELVRQINKTAAPVNMKMMVARSVILETNALSLIKTDRVLPIILSDYETLVRFCQSIIVDCDDSNRQDLSDFVISVRQYLDKYKWQFNAANK